MMRWVWMSVLLLSLTGCAQKLGRPFDIKNLAKSDMDLITDIHIAEIRDLSEALIVKLYKRNPRELKKVPGMTIEKRVAQLMTTERPDNGFRELGGMDGIALLPLAFSSEFEGDRVFALMAGVTGMISASYNHQLEFFLLDDIDQQKLYNSARNLEKIAWLLNNEKDDNGQLLLLSNGMGKNGVPNYSYERLLSQMIIIQDMMAVMVADSTNRNINQVVHSMASMTFFPI
ncbi:MULTISPECIES: hypothetical protein [Salinivibrio]|uniref:Lipoprotein n=1 Tax=Salinivibrio kushneri TaxID=1908198 RepID=A0AB36K8E8_9GAMM|nr:MULTISPECIES: hypothetical protein [Salinivibrio]ODP99419.1 hypothetical protein BGL48_08085 [Salinivibrio sp. BNH]OOE35383.1 hypothetical protein BZG05_04950 [Salinivibrio kushneri]OOE37925.1 hypothetical protein BZG04_01865 [Salinivibrio kushneri]OOE44098.1 hypothetical protein BZG06_10035 [Salinivibrio kushneri]OOE45565.1 hypothetical protein BZG09_03935 [Salinivibrio kushneri]